VIELLKESDGRAVGFKVSGRVTKDDVEGFEPQIERAMEHAGKRPIGILVDLSAMDGASWSARWEEIRFLSRWKDRIARVAVVGARRWEEIRAEVLGGTVLVEADTRYYDAGEPLHAWHWVKTGDRGAGSAPVLKPRQGLMAGYEPEYMEV
jgi:stage II sporulation SpoAA-like protein